LRHRSGTLSAYVANRCWSASWLHGPQVCMTQTKELNTSSIPCPNTETRSTVTNFLHAGARAHVLVSPLQRWWASHFVAWNAWARLRNTQSPSLKPVLMHCNFMQVHKQLIPSCEQCFALDSFDQHQSHTLPSPLCRFHASCPSPYCATLLYPQMAQRLN
jgi:hypothetical protein